VISRRALAFWTAIGLASASGCADVAGPNWLAPGSAPEQQRRAQWFDPYPSPDAGPMDSTVRPRAYQHPPPEADTRVRNPRGIMSGRW
jgi:hypothetical protein